MLLDFVKADRGLDDQTVESVVSSTMMCQCLWMLPQVICLCLKKGVMMARIFVSVCTVRRKKSCLRVCVRAFIMFHVSNDEMQLI